MTNTRPALDELPAALHRLSDVELQALTARMHSVAETFRVGGLQRVANVFAVLTVAAAEEGDRRRDLAEHARVQVDGDEVGSLLANDPESLAVLAELPDLDHRD